MHAQVEYCPTVNPNDLLSEVLQDLRLSHVRPMGAASSRRRWGIEIPYKEGIRFHFVAEGRCCMFERRARRSVARNRRRRAAAARYGARDRLMNPRGVRGLWRKWDRSSLGMRRTVWRPAEVAFAH